MEWEDDDFENQLVCYSEIETVTKDQPAPPITILQYNKCIQSNNSVSIFDADYSLNEPHGHNSPVRNSKNRDDHEDVGVFKDEKVTFVLSGRGRGGRNHIFKPGDTHSSKTLNGDDEIRQQIRKVAPMGYSNEITENLVKAHQKSKLLTNGAANITTNKSKTNSPCLSKSSSPLSSEKISGSPLRPGNKNALNSHSPIQSEKSMSHTTSDPYSSEYFTSNDQHLSPSSSTSNSTPNKMESDENQEDYSEKDCSTVTINKSEVNFETNKGATSKRPVPLSVMLQRSREEHRRKHLKAQSNANELATQRKIVEILKQDQLEAERRRKILTENSSASSSSSWDDQPSWRQRNNSPPRYAWNQMRKGREPRELNINSFDDFPSLK